MTWSPLTFVTPFQPELPDHCAPVNDFLLHFSRTFHVCIPTPLAFASNAFGSLSIFAWLFAQIPQIYRNWKISSTAGLSICFLFEWFLGDLANLLGALFTHQAPWQVCIGGYYVFVDFCLLVQWLWYEKLRHGNVVKRVKARARSAYRRRDEEDMHQIGYGAEGGNPAADTECDPDATARQNAAPRPIFRVPTFDRSAEEEKPLPSLGQTPRGTTIHRTTTSASASGAASPRIMLLLVCLAAMVQASPAAMTPRPPFDVLEDRTTILEDVGTAISWCSTLLYLGSRLPQLLKNWRRKSTAGLSPHLFAAAFCGNLLYSAALATNPNAWSDFDAYGGHGWADQSGNDRAKWVAAALPFFLGAFGVLGLDASVGVQFLMYDREEGEVVVLEESVGDLTRWRRVSGWMRGWIPSSASSDKGEETESLLPPDDSVAVRYGGA